MNRTTFLKGILLAGLAVFFSAPLAQAQQFLGKPADHWAGQLDADEARARRAAAFALGKLGVNAAFHADKLVAVLKNDADPTVREAAAFALGDICKHAAFARNTDGLLATLRDKLTSDKSPLVRRSSAYALGCMGDQAANALEDLNKAAGDSDAGVRQNVAWALGQVGSSSVLTLQNMLSQEKDPVAIRDAAGALANIGSDAAPAVRQLIQHCNHPDLEVQKAVLLALVPIVKPDDVNVAAGPLQRVVKDNKRLVEVRRNAALALSNIGGKAAAPAVPILIKVLQTDELAYQRQAAVGIRNIGPDAKDAVEPLTKVLHHDDEDIRKFAAMALGGIGPNATSAVPQLVSLLIDNKQPTNVREEAAVALRHIGKCEEAENAIPALLRVLENRKNTPQLRTFVLWALRANGPQVLLEQTALHEALERILATEKSGVGQTKMLRYDSAYLLGVLLEDNVSDNVIDTLHEFLKDTTVKVYIGEATKVEGGGQETGAGDAKFERRGEGDGRVIAIQALNRIGVNKIRQTRPEIIAIMRDLANTSDDPRLKKMIKETLSRFGV